MFSPIRRLPYASKALSFLMCRLEMFLLALALCPSGGPRMQGAAMDSGTRHHPSESGQRHAAVRLLNHDPASTRVLNFLGERNRTRNSSRLSHPLSLRKKRRFAPMESVSAFGWTDFLSQREAVSSA